MKKRLIIGMSGASGAPLTVELLKQLNQNCPDIETNLIITRGGEMTLASETDLTLDDLRKMATVCHDNHDIGACVASGSFRTMGMIVIPCSMKTVAGIVTGYSNNLLLRAADVCLKERRKLVLVARESPLSAVHLRNLYEAARFGAVILPPVPAYYRGFSTAAQMTEYTVQRILAQFELESDVWEWQGG